MSVKRVDTQPRRPFEVSLAMLRHLACRCGDEPSGGPESQGHTAAGRACGTALPNTASGGSEARAPVSPQLGLTIREARPVPGCHTDPKDGSHTCCGDAFGGWCVCHGVCDGMKAMCTLFGLPLKKIAGGYTCGDVPVA